MEGFLIKVLEIGFLPILALIITNWYKLTRLTEKDKNRNNYLIRLGEKMDRVERHLVKNSGFDPGTDSGFFDQ